MSKIYYLIWIPIIVILIIVSNWFSKNLSYINKKDPAFLRAKAVFSDNLYSNRAKGEHFSTLITALVSTVVDNTDDRLNWVYDHETEDFINTKNDKFPFLLNHKVFLKNNTKPNEFIINNQLYIYNVVRAVWLPLSYDTGHYDYDRDYSLMKEIKGDLWTTEKDWANL